MKVEVDVEEEDFWGIDLEMSKDLPYNLSIAHNKLKDAFDKERNRIKIGDWVRSVRDGCYSKVVWKYRGPNTVPVGPSVVKVSSVLAKVLNNEFGND